MRDGLVGVAVPHNSGFALIGDADGDDSSGGGFGERVADGLPGALPDFDRIVLYPAGLRVVLAVFELVRGDGAAAVVEEHATRAGRALIDGGDQLGHGASLTVNNRAICNSASPAPSTSIIPCCMASLKFNSPSITRRKSSLEARISRSGSGRIPS